MEKHSAHNFVRKPFSNAPPSTEPFEVEVPKYDDLDHLSSDERRILEQQLSMPSAKISYLMLYRYATRTDISILLLSTLCAMVSGAVMPLMTVRIFSGIHHRGNGL